LPARCGYGRRTTFSGVPSVLEVTDLRTQFTLRTGNVVAVDGVSLSVAEGESLGVVGESGCGKTTLGLSIMRLLPGNGRIASGRVLLAGRDLATLDEREMRAVRGNEVALIPQNPMTSLNPTKTIGWQLVEAVRLHRDVSTGQARQRALDVLTLVEMPRPAERVGQYPHELSGGLRQRVMIAMALACEPKLLIADEPTTALDVTIQAQILDLIDGLRERLRMAVVLITHDMGVIAGRTDNVAVMYAGKVVERTNTETLFTRMRHPYSDALLASVPKIGPNQSDRLLSIPGLPPDLSMVHTNCRFNPRCTYATDRCRDEEPPLTAVTGDDASGNGPHEFACFHPVNVEHRPLAVETEERDEGAAARRAAELDGRPEMLGIEHLVKEFPVMKGGVFRRQVGTVKAVSDVSFSIRTGEAFGLVGESGCGKTTVGSLAVALQKANSGKLRIEGQDVQALDGGDLRRLRADVQLMFQDPYSSLNPRMRVGAIVGEPLKVHERGSPTEQRARVYQLLDEVGLSPAAIDRYPHEFSGGQRQRIGLARALALNPKLIVADEPVSALDVSIQAQILNLMKDLQARHHLTFVLISHDLAVVRYMVDTIGVMYLGKLVELGPAHEVYERPAHPYTRGLLDAVPEPDPIAARQKLGVAAVRGELPSAVHPPSGCRFRTRCPRAEERCALEEPPLVSFGTGHVAACHFPLETPTRLSAPSSPRPSAPDLGGGGVVPSAN
jgi:peptide/nickel transport system ATP-binding protein